MRTVSVLGHGTATAVPDSALVQVAAVHRAGSLAEALGGAESARAAVVGAADGLVVSSTGLQVWPAHDQQGRQAGYEARHGLGIACPTVEAAGALLTRLAAEVGDRLQVEGVVLAVTDPTPWEARAREAAMADARARAEHLAALAGESLGVLVQVVEGGAAVPGGGRELMARTTDVSLSPGQTAIGVSLSVTWSLD